MYSIDHIGYTSVIAALNAPFLENHVNAFKYSTIIMLIGLLIGCGHGFEGEYKTSTGSSIEFLDTFADSISGNETLVIGSDYIESAGERTLYDEIFVRQSGSTQYLIFVEDGQEQAWKIIDKKTLQKGTDIINIRLTRVD